jgi:hypothetical protein
MGLIGGMARTAVAAGTWTAVSNRVARRQYNRWSEQEQAQAYQAQQQAPMYQTPAPAPVAAAPAQGGRDRVAQLKDLADLKAQGILTEDEFAAQKARILAS